MRDDSNIDPERIARQPLVGVDNEGAEHRFDQYNDTMYVLQADGTLDHVEHLQPGQLPAWINYVAEQRGWTDCRYAGNDPFASVAERLAHLLKPTP